MELLSQKKESAATCSPSTLSNHADDMKNITKILSEKSDGISMDIYHKYNQVSKFWTEEVCRKMYVHTKKYREGLRTISNLKKAGKFIPEEDIKTMYTSAKVTIHYIMSKSKVSKDIVMDFIEPFHFFYTVCTGVLRTNTLCQMIIDANFTFENQVGDIIDWNIEENRVDGIWKFRQSSLKNAIAHSRSIYTPISIPTKLNRYILFYLDIIRPLLIKNDEEKAFWINKSGTPMTDSNRLTLMKLFCESITGKVCTIQNLRYCLSGHIMSKNISNIEKKKVAQLMDHSIDVAEKHYSFFLEPENNHDIVESILNFFDDSL